MKKAILIHKPSLILHLGDFLTDCPEGITVAGNCDSDQSSPRELELMVEGWKLFLAHGDQYGVKMGTEIIRRTGMMRKVDILLFGHTHCVHEEQDGGMWLLNPGSIGRPKDGFPSFLELKLTSEKREYRFHKISGVSFP